MGMEVWNSAKIVTQINGLEEKSRLDIEGQLFYILNPFIKSLGYDIYDIESVDTQVQAGRIVLRVLPEVTITFSVSNVLPKEEGQMFVSLLAKQKILELRILAMGRWELVEQIDLTAPLDTIGEAYTRVIRLIAQESCQVTYAERGKRMFTERILATKLAEGDMTNNFLASAVKTLLDSPSDSLLLCIAELLAEEFSTDSAARLHEQLQPLKQQGLRPLISEYLTSSIVMTSPPAAKAVAAKPAPIVPISLPVSPSSEDVKEVAPTTPLAAVLSDEIVGGVKLEEEVTEELTEEPTVSSVESPPKVVAPPIVKSEEEQTTEQAVEVPSEVPKGDVRSIDDLFGKPPVSVRKTPPTRGL